MHKHLLAMAAAAAARAYHIGAPGSKWGPAELSQWRAERIKSRSYDDDVVKVLDSLRDEYDIIEYGTLTYEGVSHKLYAARSKDWNNRPKVLVTGGVHGYETSGVHGALRLLQTKCKDYAERGLDILVAPCVSPWGYEHIQRWNYDAIDPNRSFKRNDPDACGSQEARALVNLVREHGSDGWACHIDLHETTDTDESEFQPAKAARDGDVYEEGTIPDGFYLCGDEKNPRLEFQRAVIKGVSDVTHIAPADPDGTIIGSPVVADGVILYDYTALGLCGGVTDAPLTTTTEVYPDSEKATAEECNKAQVESVLSALDFLLAERSWGPAVKALGGGMP
jgi:hypothetical protein